MNYLSHISLLLLSSVSLTSCFQQDTPTPTNLAQTNNAIYLHSIVTKTENAVTKFNTMIAQGNVVVDFYADWCGPCKVLANTINQIAAQYSNVTFLKVNTDMYPELAGSIRSIPTVVFYKNGKQVHRQTGALNRQQMTSLIQKFF